jgi:hypothetical protein
MNSHIYWTIEIMYLNNRRLYVFFGLVVWFEIRHRFSRGLMLQNTTPSEIVYYR